MIYTSERFYESPPIRIDFSDWKRTLSKKENKNDI